MPFIMTALGDGCFVWIHSRFWHMWLLVLRGDIGEKRVKPAGKRAPWHRRIVCVCSSGCTYNTLAVVNQPLNPRGACRSAQIRQYESVSRGNLMVSRAATLGGSRCCIRSLAYTCYCSCGVLRWLSLFTFASIAEFTGF